MKIYTKKGDKGFTGLIGGTRVSKNNIRIEAYGTIDELNSYLGLLSSFSIGGIFKEQIHEIQDRLFTMGSILASDPNKSKMQLPQLYQEDIQRLEVWIDEFEKTIPVLTSFILPGGHPNGAHAHVARCICRRAERIVVSLCEIDRVEDVILSYLNRLSDYLFVLSRKLNFEEGCGEQLWLPRN